MRPPPGLVVAGPVLVLHGEWLDVTLHAIAAAQRRRSHNGLPPGRALTMLAQAVASAQRPSGQTDTANATNAHDGVEPTVSVTEAATRLGVCERTIRRKAPRLGGKKIRGRWLLDDDAVHHEEGR